MKYWKKAAIKKMSDLQLDRAIAYLEHSARKLATAVPPSACGEMASLYNSRLWDKVKLLNDTQLARHIYSERYDILIQERAARLRK